MNIVTYLLLRLTIGMSMFGHGLVRLTKLTAFSSGMANTFSHSPLPYALVKPFSLMLPFAEFAIGCLLLAGLFTRGALIAGCVLMIMLIFGTCMIENWDALVSQLIHSFLFAVLLQFKSANLFSLDNMIFKTHTPKSISFYRK